MPAVAGGHGRYHHAAPPAADAAPPLPRRRSGAMRCWPSPVVAVFGLAAFVGSQLFSGNIDAQTVRMPKVTGLSEADARAALARDGFTDPTVTTRADDLPVGNVLEQDPKAGVRVDPAKTTVALGSRPAGHREGARAGRALPRRGDPGAQDARAQEWVRSHRPTRPNPRTRVLLGQLPARGRSSRWAPRST